MSRVKSPPEPGQEEFQTQWVGADSILFATAHRPWPLPAAPWIMTQRWNDLLFLHYPINPEVVRAKVPAALTVDTYQQRAWISITPFWINHLRPPGVPSFPWVSSFNEINVRTYVTYGGKPGVYFFSLDASNLSAVWGARMFYRLPYWQASMNVKGKGTARVEYASKREHGPKPADIKLSYGPSSSRSMHAHPASLEHFLTERYCLYSVTKKRLYRGEIHHLPWDLQPANVEIEQNSMAQTAGFELPAEAEMVRFSRELKVLFWAPERLL